MTKKVIASLGLLLILFTLIWLLQNKDNKKEKKQNLRTGISTTATVNKESIAKKIHDKKIKQPIKKDWLEGYEKENDHTPKVGLIQAFREFRKVKRCRVIIEAVADSQDPYQAYLSVINRNNKGNDLKVLTPTQRDFFDKWSDSCLDLLDYDGELYTAAHERYRKRFYQTKPKTKLEKDFAQSWPLKEETSFIAFKFQVFKKPFNGENQKIINAINRKMGYIKGLLSYITINDDIEFSSRTTNEIAMYEYQLAELEGILDGSIIIDEDYLSKLSQEYELKIQKVDEFLKQNISSEAFITIAPHIFENRSKEIGFYHTLYFNELSKPVYQLFACSMDADCGELAQTMVWECFKSHQANEVACGKGIEEYYLSHFYSPNQLIDVDHFLTYLFENYAKN